VIYRLRPIQLYREMTSYYMEDMQEGTIRFGVFCIRLVYRVMTCCRRWRGESMTVQRTLRIPPYKLEEGSEIPSPFVTETWDNGDAQRTWIQYSGPIQTRGDPFEVRGRSPWMWFGYELPSGDTIDLTSEMAEFVVPGNLVTHQLVHTYFPKSKYGRIMYADRVSFGMTELSPEGLTIEDAPFERNIRFGRRVCTTPDPIPTGDVAKPSSTD
jgi:hypothetical protein